MLKVFSKFGKARHHAMREWRGLEQLQARKINSPEPLFCGRCPEGWGVATAWLDDAIAAEELWKAAETTERKVQIVGLIATELARHHDRGILQTDMHLGNFMIRGKEVFAIDPAMIRFVNNPIDRRESIRQLAQLAVLLPEGSGSPIESVFREYAAARSWTVGPQDVEQLHREHRRCRNRGVERGLRKFLRVNRRHQEIRNGAWRGLASRRFSEQTSLEALTTGLDEIMARGRILKNGRTAFVSRVTLGGMDVVVKIDGDGQMNPALMRHFVRPIARGKADYTKGNRFYRPESLRGMPAVRLIGNAALSFINKLSTGYWPIMDPTNGYTAIHSAVLRQLPLDKLERRYFFESDMLYRLNVLRAVVQDVPMDAVYADEESSLRVSKVLPEFLGKHIARFFKRYVYQYLVRDFNIGSLYSVLGTLLCLAGLLFGSARWLHSIATGLPASSGTVMAAALPIFIGIQFLIAFLHHDVSSVPREPLCTEVVDDA